MARALLAFLDKHCRLPREAALQREHASILCQTNRLYVLSGICIATLFMVAFNGRGHPATILIYVVLLTFYVSLLLAGSRWRQTGRDVRFIRRATLLLLGLGCAWGCQVTQFSEMLTVQNKPALVGLAMALVSSPMLCVPLPAALAFFIPVAAGCLVSILATIDVSYVVHISFIAYLAFSLTGILYTNKTTMDRLIGRLNLQREHETVRVFLREYEEVSTDWLWETDTRLRLRNVGQRLADTARIAPALLEGMSLPEMQILHGGGRGDYEAMVKAMRNRIAFRDRIIALTTPDGVRWLNVTGHPVHDDRGLFRGYRGIGSDITAARLDQQRIEFMARHDGLTRLLSRRAFVSDAVAAIERTSTSSRALLMIDLDDFKQVNDDLGHAAGDALLETVAARLQDHIAPNELAARIGGDEFALLLETPDQDSALSRARSIAGSLLNDAGDRSIPLSARVTIGIAMAPDHGSNLDQLMRRADLALYEAKKQGKGMACLFEMRMEAAFLSRQRLLDELALAIEQNQILAEFQPIVDVGSGQIVSAEALVRWAHPTRGLLAAGSFVLAAENSDLIEPLGAHMLRLSCQAAMAWTVEIPVSVNLSPRQLRSGRFVPILTECLAETRLPPNRLILEVTETVFLDAGPRITQQLDVIRAMGVRLVLDDFGTGYSSLTYLRRFEVDGIKIDASFVRDLPGSRKVGAIVRTIGRLASDMNIYVTAEGVETEEQLRWLRGNGIAFAQGYLLGRPGADPVDAIARASLARDRGSLRPVEHGRA